LLSPSTATGVPEAPHYELIQQTPIRPLTWLFKGAVVGGTWWESGTVFVTTCTIQTYGTSDTAIQNISKLKTGKKFERKPTSLNGLGCAHFAYLPIYHFHRHFIHFHEIVQIVTGNQW